MLQAERAREAEQTARAEAEETEALRRLCSQLPRPIMSARTETSITLSLARLMKSSGEDKVILPQLFIVDLRICVICLHAGAPTVCDIIHRQKNQSSMCVEVGGGTGGSRHAPSCQLFSLTVPARAGCYMVDDSLAYASSAL